MRSPSNNPSLTLLELRGSEFPLNSLETTLSCPYQTTQDSSGLDKLNDDEIPVLCIGQKWCDAIPLFDQSAELIGLHPYGIALIPSGDITAARRLGERGVRKVVGYTQTTDGFQSSLGDDILSFKKSSEGRSSSLRHGKPHIEKRAVIFADERSKSMLELVRRLAGFDVSALLSGESGVGKEVVAKILHDQSPRTSRPFVALNCAAIPENLVESILFGHVKGAFTGAHQDQEGVFEQAHGGVLFLDEVGELPLHTQPKLLRAIQEQKVCRVGGNKSVDVNVRLVSATNRDLNIMVSSGEFREDLLYRLNSFHLSIPPLRERPLDLEALAIHFAESHSCAGRVMQLSQDALRRLLAHDWPGNVRELENVISRAKVVADMDVICEEHILLDACVSSLPTNYSVLGASPTVTTQPSDSLATTKESAEWLAIQDALANTASKADAAKVLGISPRTLRHKIQKLNEREDQLQRKIL